MRFFFVSIPFINLECGSVEWDVGCAWRYHGDLDYNLSTKSFEVKCKTVCVLKFFNQVQSSLTH